MESSLTNVTYPTWQGAEARVYKGEFAGQPAIYKQRFSKKYRHPTLDTKLNARRITQEARCIARAWKCGVSTPTIYYVDAPKGLLIMEFIDGITVKHTLRTDEGPHPQLAQSIGKAIATLHNHNIIHGDLTTSNMMLRGTELVMIDFGLAIVSASLEDRAVDMYVLERAILSTHPVIGTDFFAQILETYSDGVTNAKGTLARLAEVQRRGRKREMIG